MRSIPFPPAELLRHSCGRAAALLSLGAHTVAMEPAKPQKIVLAVLAALMLFAWALVIWIATVVTRTALETLAYIVDLAQYTP